MIHVVPTFFSLLKFTPWACLIQRSPPVIAFVLSASEIQSPGFSNTKGFQLSWPSPLPGSAAGDACAPPSSPTRCAPCPRGNHQLWLQFLPVSDGDPCFTVFISVCFLASHLQNGHIDSHSATSSAIPSPPTHLFPTHKLPICSGRFWFGLLAVWNFISFLGLQSLKSSTTIWASFKKKSVENQGPCSKLLEERPKGSVSACLDISYQGPLLLVFQTGNSPVEAHDTFSFTGWITF